MNRESSWCQRFHGFATELHDWLRSLTNSREYSYGVSTNKHDSATAALTVTNHYGLPRYTTILQIFANRSGTVAKNRECVKACLHIHDFWLRFRYEICKIVVYRGDS